MLALSCRLGRLAPAVRPALNINALAMRNLQDMPSIGSLPLDEDYAQEMKDIFGSYAWRQERKQALLGYVISTKMDRTINVRVEAKHFNRKYNKVLIRHHNVMAHDPDEVGQLGDLVRIVPCRKYSNNKAHHIMDVIKRVNISKEEDKVLTARPGKFEPYPVKPVETPKNLYWRGKDPPKQKFKNKPRKIPTVQYQAWMDKPKDKEVDVHVEITPEEMAEAAAKQQQTANMQQKV